MLEKGKISNISVFFALMNIVGATAVVSLPSIAAHYAKQDAWMTPIIANITGIIVILLVTELGRRFPGKTIIEYLQIILGIWLGKAVGFLYAFFFIFALTGIIREFSELLGTMLMPHTPVVVLSSVFILLAAYAVRSGLEVIARLLVMLQPGILVLYTLILLFGLAKADFFRLLPVLENGFKPVILGSFIPSAWNGQFIVLAVFLPFLAEPQKGRFLGIWSSITLTGFLIATAVINTAIFGPSVVRLAFPTFMIPSKVLIGGFLRVDAILIIFWLAAMLTKISQFYYCTVLCTAQLLNLKDYKALVLPFGVILVAMSVLSFSSSAEVGSAIIYAFAPFSHLMEWMLPLALLLIAIIRRFKAKY